MISRRNWVWCVVSCLSLIFAGATGRTCRAEDTARGLLPYLPESSNVVAVVRVDKILSSPRGQSEGWASEQQEKFLAGASNIPPHVSTLVLGMQVRPHASEVVSSVGLALIPGGVRIDSFAERETGAQTETIGGRPAVESQHNAFYVELTPTVLGIISPAARQEASRYVRRVTSSTSTQVPAGYLGIAAQRDHQVVIAMDLADLGNPVRIRERLDKLQGVAGNATVRDELLDLLTTVRGICFTADVNDKTHARLVVDFGRKPSNSAKLLKGMLLNIIAESGMHVDELTDAAVEIEDESLVLIMPNFSDSSLRMVLSLIAPASQVPTAPAPSDVAANTKPTPPTPTIPSTPEPRSKPSTSSSALPEAKASLRYFNAVNQCLDDLQNAGRRGDTNPAQSATWHENMARKIDNLPTRGVDPGLIRYGAEMSERLRAIGASMRGIAIEVNAAQNSIVWNSSYDPGYAEMNFWGGYGYRAPSYQVTSNLQQVREKQADSVVRGAKDREAAWLIVQNERQRMTLEVNAKYGAK